MKKIIFLTFIFVSIFAYSQKSAEAIGVGFYLEGGGGPSYFWYTGSHEGQYNNAMGFFGGGVVFDTNVSTKSIFNYRSEIGYAWKRNIKWNAPDYKYYNSVISFDLDTNEIKLVNTFGFSLYSTETIRLWLGPQLNILVLWVDTPKATHPITVTGMTSEKSEYIFALGGLGLGVVLGLNINFKGFVTLTIEAGFRANFTVGSSFTGADYYNGTAWWGYYYGSPALLNLTPEGFATVGVLFRFIEK